MQTNKLIELNCIEIQHVFGGGIDKEALIKLLLTAASAKPIDYFVYHMIHGDDRTWRGFIWNGVAKAISFSVSMLPVTFWYMDYTYEKKAPKKKKGKKEKGRG